MRDLKLPPAVTSELRLGSRPATTGLARLALDNTPEPERPSHLREFFERLGVRYDAERLNGDPVEVDLILRGLPGIQYLSGRMRGNYRRRCEKADPTEDIGLVINPGGPLCLSQGGREIVLGGGEGTVVCLTEPVDAMHRAPAHFRALRFPTALLNPRLANWQDSFLRRIPSDSAALGLLVNYIDNTWQEQTLANRDLQHLIVSHLYDLMAVAIGATRDAAEEAKTRGVYAARLLAIKQDIARFLDRSDLSVAALAARHRCTPRVVQRAFEMAGTTFTEYVLVQRLERARGMLIDPRYKDEKISTIAYDSGFADVSYFNRMFRRSYGESPSDVRAQAHRSQR